MVFHMDEQWNVICYLAELFERNGIEYQFDASTSVFIHGIDFLMDDIDVIVLKKYKNKVLDLFTEFEKTDIVVYNNFMEYIFTYIQGQKVHLMFIYNKVDCIEETRDIVYNGIKIHVKMIEFYRKHIKDDHPLIELIDKRIKMYSNLDSAERSENGQSFA